MIDREIMKLASVFPIKYIATYYYQESEGSNKRILNQRKGSEGN